MDEIPNADPGMRKRGERPASGIVNAMSVDIEDYFQVHALEPHFSRAEWDRVPTRVGDNIDRTLDLFARHDVRATFFILGWVAQRFPDHVRRIASAGHEIASHGFAHHRVTELSPDEFRRDLADTRALLEELGGQQVRGYRAPSYSIGETNRWALEVLEEEGYDYSSSIYPIRHDHYGMPDAPRHGFRPTSKGRLLELPITTVEWGGRRLPCGGGGYFRLYPYRFSRWALRRVNERDGAPAIFFFHPWEIDPWQPRVPNAALRTRFRHYLNLERMEVRLDRLLSDFRWDRMDRVFLDEGKAQ
jgi:polysaccharide deacetylase family protein (PEP-CTERM system associated)